MSVTPMRKLYTEAEAAEALRCSRATLRKLQVEGKLKYHTVANKRVLTVNNLLEYLGMPLEDEGLPVATSSDMAFPPINILPIESLRFLPPASMVKASGVYFLWLDKELVYIGQSESVSHRCGHHRQACENVFFRSINFDFSTAMAVEWPYHLAVEAAYIRAYPTKNNRKA